MNTHNILFVIESLNIGGAEVYVEKLLRHLDRERFRPVVCCLVQKGELAASIEARGIPVVALGWRVEQGAGGPEPKVGPRVPRLANYAARVRFYFSTLRTVFRLASLMRAERVHLAQTFFYRPEVVTAVARWLGGRPLVVGSQYDTIQPEGILSRLALTFSRPAVTHVVANCAACSSHRQKLSGHPAGRTSVIYIGLDREERARAAQSGTPAVSVGGRDFLPADFFSGGPVVSYAGRLLPLKGPDVFLKAASAVHRKLAGVKFLLIGEGAMRAELLALASSLGIGEVLWMPGHVELLENVLSKSSALVCASRSEGFPSILLEAMALGVPVVSSRVGGVQELVEDGVNGFLFESEDHAGLASILETLLSDSELAARTAERAREKVLREYRFEDTVSQTQALYERLLGAGHRRTHSPRADSARRRGARGSVPKGQGESCRGSVA